MLTKSLGDIDWEKSAVSIERLIRGLNPWPSAYTMWNGKTIKIWSADVLGKDEEEGIAHSVPSLDSAPRGTVVCSGKRSLVVKTGEGLLLSLIHILWVIEMDQDRAPRMYSDKAMLELLGLKEMPSPEECYERCV